MLPFLLIAAGGGGDPGTADFTFSAFSTAEPLRRTDTPTGDARLSGGIGINRIRWDGLTLTFNQIGGGFADWVTGRGTWKIILTIGTSDVDLRISARFSVGGGFLTWRPSAADRALLNGIDPGDDVRIRVQP